MILTVTKEQAAMVREAETAKQAAARDAQIVLSAITAGHLPVGAALTHVDVDAGTLTFHVESDG